MSKSLFIDQRPILHPILGIAFINFILIILMLIVFYSFFANPVGYEIRLPAVVHSQELDRAIEVIRITSENVLYLNDKVVTIGDLKRALIKINPYRVNFYIRVDKKATMARLGEVCDLCKGLGASKVKIILE